MLLGGSDVAVVLLGLALDTSSGFRAYKLKKLFRGWVVLMVLEPTLWPFWREVVHK